MGRAHRADVTRFHFDSITARALTQGALFPSRYGDAVQADEFGRSRAGGKKRMLQLWRRFGRKENRSGGEAWVKATSEAASKNQRRFAQLDCLRDGTLRVRSAHARDENADRRVTVQIGCSLFFDREADQPLTWKKSAIRVHPRATLSLDPGQPLSPNLVEQDSRFHVAQAIFGNLAGAPLRQKRADIVAGDALTLR